MFRALFSSRSLAGLLTAWTLGRLSVWSSTMLFGLFAHQIGGAPAVGAAMVARMVPAAIAAPALALLADRWPRRRVLWLGIGLRGLLTAGAGVMIAGGAGLAPVLAVAAVIAMLSTAHRPPHAALIPALAPTPAAVGGANIGTTIGNYVGFMFGSVAAGLIAAEAGIPTAMAASAGAALLAAMTVALVPHIASADDDETAPTDASIASGVRVVWRDRDLRALAGVHLAENMALGMVAVLLVVAAIELLGTGQAGVGMLNGAMGVGGIVGAVLGTMALRRARLGVGLVLGLVVSSLPLVVVGLLPVPSLALVMLIATGVGFALIDVAVMTMTQRLAAEDVLSRVFGIHELLNVAGAAIGASLAPLLIATLSTSTALIVTGLILPVVALVGARVLRRLGADVVPPARPYALLRAVPMLSPLPLATIETLAVLAKALCIREGTVLIREGDQGDAVYIIDTGSLAINEAARGARPTMLAGSFIGEIALLHNTTRTATVTAAEDTTLLVIDSATFLRAVGSHPRSHHSANALASSRLH